MNVVLLQPKKSNTWWIMFTGSHFLCAYLCRL